MDLDSELRRYGRGEDVIAREISRWTYVGDRVLEAGCGSGRYLALLQEVGCLGVGVDFATGALADAKARRVTLPLVAADVNATPFADGTFDAVVSLGVIEHFQNGPEATLREHRRVLRQGGILILTVPRVSPLKRALDAVGLAGSRDYVSAVGRRVARVRSLGSEGNDSGAWSFRQYEFPDRMVLRQVVAAGLRPIHVHGYSFSTGLREIPGLEKLLVQTQPLRQKRAAEDTGVRDAAPSSTLRNLYATERASGSWALPILKWLRYLAGHSLVVVARAGPSPSPDGVGE